MVAKSFVTRYEEMYASGRLSIGTHVDDIFGGCKNCTSFQEAAHFRDFISTAGAALTVRFNPKPEKTPMPSKRQVILGRQYDSTTARVNASEKKDRKYRLRIAAVLALHRISSKELE